VKARDIALGLLAAICVAAVTFFANRLIPTTIFLGTNDMWFEADLRRVYSNMIDRFGDHYRAKVHPLFSLIAYSLTYVPRCLFHLDPVTSVRIVIVIAAFVWGLVLFALLRFIAGAWPALVLTLLAGVSATSLFINSVPETYLLGSISILGALLAAALTRREVVLTAASALTLSFTLTNWMAGIAAAIAALPWRRAVQVTINAFAIVVLLWGFQRYFFNNAQFFLGDKEERDYMYRPTATRVAEAANGFFITPMVMPKFVPEFRYYQVEGVLFTQHAKLGSSGAIGIAAIALWAALLILGIGGLTKAAELRPLQAALLLTIAGQLALHILYGEETFLYSPHFAPLLIVLAAFAFRTRARTAALAIAIALTITAGINNAQQLRRACDYVRHPILQPKEATHG